MDDLQNIPKADRPPIPLETGQWHQWDDYEKVDADLSHGSVSAPAELVAPLEGITSDAASKGLDLKIVFTDQEVPLAAWVRDMAIRLSQEHEGTIVVFTPEAIGTQSDTLSRAVLESAQDDAYREESPVQAAAVFESKVTQPGPSWALWASSIVLVLVLAVVVFVVALRRRARRT